MSEPRVESLQCLSPAGFHRVIYYEWGGVEAEKTVLCVHGLTRTGRDFDYLARALVEDGYRVVCPDIVGRGRSDWLRDRSGYGYPQYLADMATLIARLNVGTLDWVGTSMGGLIGMMLAAQPDAPIRRLVLNDVGPFVPAEALRRIGRYLGKDEHFADMEEAEAYIRRVHAPYGELEDAQWRHLTRHAVRPEAEGGFRLAYDPSIALPFRDEAAIEDLDLWPVWEALTAPTLVLRGEASDLLLGKTAEEMAFRGPQAQVETMPGCGHAPALMDEAQIGQVRSWLR